MATQHIENKLKLLPDLPGCYMMKDINSRIIYVGKAKNLKNRVRSYFKSSHEGKTAKLVSEIRDFETIITSTDKEAFLLEITLIQKHKPYYNIKLKRGTGYPYIKITHEKDPQLKIVSQVKKDGGYYFGPYPNVYAATETLQLLQKVYPLRRCNGYQKRPCLYYHMGQCLGACFKEVPQSEYEKQIKKIKSFLNGNVSKIKKELEQKMETASENLEFERAAEIRDQIHYVEMTVEKQKIISNDNTPRDLFAFYMNKGWLYSASLQPLLFWSKVPYLCPYYCCRVLNISHFFLMSVKPLSLNLINCFVLVVLFVVSLSVGVGNFRWADVFHWTLSDSTELMLVSRLPRTFAIVLTGASMAVAGMIMQILMRNRFVEPSMVGASQSAALGVLVMTLMFPAAGLTAKMSVAAVAALAGMLVFMMLIRRLPPTAQLMVPLVGIIFGGVIEAVATFIAYEFEMMQMLSVWQQGDFSGVLLGRYELLWLTGGLALTAYLIADQLTILGLGETVSVNLGLNRTAVLWVGLVIVALITSLVLVTVGNIPFIGLVVPNIISRLMGDKLRQSLPAVALLGASLVLLCDILGRVIVFPFEIPVSTVFGVLGTVLFLWILLRKPAHVV